MNQCFKKIILFFCIFSLIIMPLQQKKASAFTGVEEVATIGGVTITSGMVVTAVGALVVAGGATLYANTDSTDLKYIASGLISSGEVAKSFGVQVTNTGKTFLTWTADGISWVNNKISEMVSSNTSGVVGANTITIASGFNYSSLVSYTRDSPFNTGYSVSAKGGDSVEVYSTGANDQWIGNVSNFHFDTAGTYDIFISSSGIGFSSNGSHIGHWIAGDSSNYLSSTDFFMITYSADSVCSFPVGSGVKSYSNTNNQDVIGGTCDSGSLGIPLETGSDGSVSVPSVPYGQDWGGISGDYTYPPQSLNPPRDIPQDTPKDIPQDTSKDIPQDIPQDTPTTGEATQTGSQPWIFNIPILGDILKILMKILEVLKSIPLLLQKIIDWLTIDWAEVAQHINYTDILKQHFKPFFDIADLLTNIQSSSQSSNGKFYMTIPKEMGGNGQEQCVLDLTIGSVYVQTGRDIIKYGIWIGFLWYVLKTFSPKFNIG